MEPYKGVMELEIKTFLSFIQMLLSALQLYLCCSDAFTENQLLQQSN